MKAVFTVRPSTESGVQYGSREQAIEAAKNLAVVQGKAFMVWEAVALVKSVAEVTEVK